MNRVLLFSFFILFSTLPLFAQSIDTAWVRRYNGLDSAGEEPRAIAVDGSGNVYVTGHSDHNPNPPHNWDFTTIKYYPNGDTAWVRKYNGPGDAEDCGSAIAVDDSGYAYVTGWSVGSGSIYGCLTVKYKPDGDSAWMRRFEGPMNSGAGCFDLAIDNSGNVYVTGTGYNGMAYFDYLTIKYYPDGETAWVRTYNGTGDSTDMSWDIAVDIAGNVYVTGHSLGSGTKNDYVTVKYFPDGTPHWIKRYDGTAHQEDMGSDIVVDGSGNVYVTGNSYNTGTNIDFHTIKYYPNGDTGWTRRYDNPWHTDDFGTSLALDDSGNIFVAGISGGHNFVIKYRPSGDTAWTRRYQSTTGQDTVNIEPSIAVDDYGNLYLTGRIFSSYYYDFLTIKYTSEGDTAWIRTYNGPGNSGDVPKAIAIDTVGCYGNVYITGWSWGGAEVYTDYATIKYVQFLRGDANRDCKVTISDVVYILNYLFKFGPAPLPIVQAGDANCDGKVTISDAVYLLNYLFKFGPAPGDPNNDGMPDC